ncbi:peptidoglycan-binding protein [Spirillospora sp. NPDC047279]|uniref:CHAP domain-containing protein n=1 Tax=Spirillospora sp. NPDC047279 TaxID=3155478 RepID=UPI0033FE1FDD
MGTAAAMLAEARKSLGMSGRPNTITKDYAKRHGNAFLNAAWCDMGVTYWARKSGNEKAVLPNGDRAYTVWHAQDFQKIGKWHTGTVENLNKAKPGDIVFFDWGNTNSVGAIDHVGVIEKVLGGGRVQTIEANTGNACKRRIRGATEIAGYGRPAYGAAASKPPASKPSKPKPAPKPSKAPAFPGVYLRYPPLKKSETCRKWQEQMKKRGWKIVVDGLYGADSKSVCKRFQREKGLSEDGVVGPSTWRLSWEAPIT